MQEEKQQFLCTAMQNIHQILLEKSWNQYKTQRIENDDKAENRWSEHIDSLHFSLSTLIKFHGFDQLVTNLLEAIIKGNIFSEMMSMYLKFETSCSLSNIHPSPLFNFGSGFLGQEVKILSTRILSAADSPDDIFNPPCEKVKFSFNICNCTYSILFVLISGISKTNEKLKYLQQQQQLWNKEFQEAKIW